MPRSIHSPVFLALVLLCGLALLLAPAIVAIPPYVALEYLAIGSLCIATVLALVIGGRVRNLSLLMQVMIQNLRLLMKVVRP